MRNIKIKMWQQVVTYLFCKKTNLYKTNLYNFIILIVPERKPKSTSQSRDPNKIHLHSRENFQVPNLPFPTQVVGAFPLKTVAASFLK